MKCIIAVGDDSYAIVTTIDTRIEIPDRNGW